MATLVAWANPARAHEGHSHGDEPAAPAHALPRGETFSDIFQVVGVLPGDGKLWLYVDRYGSTEPVDNATVQANLDGRDVAVTRAGPAVYTVADPSFAQPGTRNLVFAVTAGDDVDLLPLSIEVPALASAAAPPAHGHGATVAAAAREPLAWAAAALLLLIGGMIGRVSAPRALPTMVEVDPQPRPSEPEQRHEDPPSRSAPKADTRKAPARATAAALGLAIAVILAQAALAQPLDQPRRQPDGSVFVPKPTQRLLGVRTTVVERSAAPVAVQLVGQVIADPNASGRVQAPQAGRIEPPEAGFPTLGGRVARGQTLAYVAPLLSAQERSAVQATLAELDAQTTIAQQRAQRLAGLAGSVSGREIAESRVELDGLRARRAAVSDALTGRWPIEASASGVLSAIHAVSGQVVDAREVLFEIVDPERLWVEALAYDAALVADIGSAQAVAAGRIALQLEFIGRGLSMRQQAVPLQFRIVAPPAGLSVGTPVALTIQTPRLSDGFVLPADAVVRSSEGPPIVLEMPSAERFVPRQVRVEPLDAGHVLITGGLEGGQRIVTVAAGLIAQIR